MNELRNQLEAKLDLYALANFNEGFSAAIDGIDELSNVKHNEGDYTAAEVLRWTAKELRGENC